MIYRRILIAVVLLLMMVAPAAAQNSQPLFYHHIPDSALDYSRIEVKFVEGSAVRLRDGALTAPSGTDFSAVLASPLVQGVERLFTRPEAELDAERSAAIAATGNTGLADLNLWYSVRLNPSASISDARAYVDYLNTLDGVQIAYPSPRPAPPPQRVGLPTADGTQATPDFSNDQDYGEAAPVGIGLTGVSGIDGADGSDVLFVDIEYDWNFDHEDLPIDASDLIAGDLYTFFGDDHGTAVIGQVTALDNGFGVTGLTPAAETKVASPIFSGDYNIGQAINLAAAQMQPGDVMLLEQQIAGPQNAVCNCGGGCDYYVPVEYWPSYYDAIKAATAAGIIVVQAGANGGLDLDDPAFGDMFDPTKRDSGAITVGAAQSWDFVPHCWSSAGPRIDLFAWGDSIYTTGYGGLFDGGPNALYTSGFGGTSGASPIITSAVIALQGVAKARGDLLTAYDMRYYLNQGGTPQGTSDREINVMPDMTTAMDAYLSDLLVNNSMERNNDGDKFPDDWTITRNGSVKADKLVCNKDKDNDTYVDKRLAQSGECAFKFRGGAGENSRMVQKVDLTGRTFAADDTLDLSVWMRGTRKPTGVIKVVVKYNDSDEKTRIRVKPTATDGYEQFTDNAQLISGDVKNIKVLVRYTGKLGALFVDDLHLTHSSAGAGLLPLPEAAR